MKKISPFLKSKPDRYSTHTGYIATDNLLLLQATEVGFLRNTTSGFAGNLLWEILNSQQTFLRLLNVY